MTNEQIDAITVAVYRRRLDEDCPGDADRMVEKDGAKKQASRARAFRRVVVATLIEVGLHEPPARTKSSV